MPFLFNTIENGLMKTYESMIPVQDESGLIVSRAHS